MVIWPLEVKFGFWAWGQSKYCPWDPQNCQSQYHKLSQKNFGNFWIFLKMKVIWPLEVKSGFWAWGHSKYGPWDPQNCQTQYQKVSQKNFGNFWICCQIEVNLIHLKVKLGLLASGKLKYGTLDSQKQPYTVRKILGNFRLLNFLGARFLLGLYCAPSSSPPSFTNIITPSIIGQQAQPSLHYSTYHHHHLHPIFIYSISQQAQPSLHYPPYFNHSSTSLPLWAWL